MIGPLSSSTSATGGWAFRTSDCRAISAARACTDGSFEASATAACLRAADSAFARVSSPTSPPSVGGDGCEAPSVQIVSR